MAAGAVVPLEVADPKDEFGDGGGARVDFDAEELVWIDAKVLHLEGEFAIAIFFELEEDFAFEAFHVLEGDVEEIAGAAGGIEDFDLAEFVVPIADFLDGFIDFAETGVSEGGGADGFPFGAEGLDDGGRRSEVEPSW